MIREQILTMNGIMDKDSESMYVNADKGVVTNRRNGRVTSTRGGNMYVNVPLRGTQEVALTLPAGTNKAIGVVDDNETNGKIFFIYNSNSNHGIYRVLLDTNTVQKIITNASYLNFTSTAEVDAIIINGLLIWTDNVNPIRKINIQRAYNYTNNVSVDWKLKYSSLSASIIQFATAHPQTSPTIASANDSTRKYNNLVGKSFQFATQYVYKDEEKSVLSPYSDLFVSSSMFDNTLGTYDVSSTDNVINVLFDLGSSDVKEVRVLAREGNDGSWFIAHTYNKTSTDISFQSKQFSFYDDVAREFLSSVESLSLSTYVPRLAKNISSAQNAAILSNILTGYDQTDVDYDLAVAFGTGNTNTQRNDVNGVLDVTTSINSISMSWAIYDTDVIDGSTFNFNFLTDVKLQDSLSRTVETIAAYNTSLVVGSSDTSSTVAQDIVNELNNNIGSIVTSFVHVGSAASYTVIPSYTTFSNYSVLFILINISGFETPSTLVSKSFTNDTYFLDSALGGSNTLKSFGAYNIGIEYEDEVGRTSGVLLDPIHNVYIPGFNERSTADLNKPAYVRWTLNSTPPSWATKYRFVISECTNLLSVFPFNSTEQVYEGVWERTNVIAIAMPTNMQYEFNNGDTIVYQSGTSIITKQIIATTTWFNSNSGFFILVPKGNDTATSVQDVLVYVHRPKKEVGETVYYEDVNTYNIVNGLHQATSGEIHVGDAWIVKRRYTYEDGNTDREDLVEDFVINTAFNIRAYGQGRPIVSLKDYGEKRTQDVIWGGKIFRNTKINDLSTIDPINNVVSLDETFGQINFTSLVGNVLKAVQDNKETSMYIGRDEFTFADGTTQLVKTGNLIGNVNVFDEAYGSRYKRAAVVDGRNLYYWDGDLGVVVRSSPNGQFPISSYGMSSFFRDLKRKMDTANGLSQDVNFILGFDKRHGELVLTYKINTEIDTVVFSEAHNGWTEFRDYYKNVGGTNQVADVYESLGDDMISFIDNSMWIHEATTSFNSIYGTFKPFSLSGICNVLPTREKSLKSLVMDSNTTFDIEIDTPVSSTATIGQKTTIKEATWKEREGRYYAPVFRNILTNSGDDTSLLFTGDSIRGRYADIKVSKSEQSDFELRTIGVFYYVVG